MSSAIKSLKSLGFPWITQDPFLFCVHHVDHYPAGNENMGPSASLTGRNIGQDFDASQRWRMYHGHKVPGFPAHPHRGFETVTVAAKGFIDHSDSLGAAGRFGEGDVQWMTAGGGVQHCEMFPLLKKDADNPLELFQIWLNLPKSKKMARPYFSMLWADKIPSHVTEGADKDKTTVRIIAGSIGKLRAPDPAPDSWAADPSHEVAIWTIKMEPGSAWEIPAASPNVNRSLYFYEGESVIVDDQTLNRPSAIELVPDVPVTLKNGNVPSSFLLLQGVPIGEPVVQYGPFVMNSQSEIQQAMREYQQTEFGGWPWSSYEHVHARERSRFARYPDGREEVKEL